MAFLLDASVFLAAFDADDQYFKSCREVLLNETITLATLDLARYEVTNVATRSWKSLKAVDKLLEAIENIMCDGGVIESTQHLLTESAIIAKQYSISVYDAAYVAASRSIGFQLVSCDFKDLVKQGLAILPSSEK